MQTLTVPSHSQVLSDTQTATAAITPKMQRIGTRYWKTLVNQGVPSGDARELAIAVIQFTYLNQKPSPYQERLIDFYSKYVNNIDQRQLELLGA